MSRNSGKNTAPEMRLRKSLWKLGLRYRLHSKLPGKPDLVFVSAKLAIFIDGCFWHGCSVHKNIPATNTDFWQSKIDKNRERDQRVNTELAELGWNVLRFWEHEIKHDLESCLARITTFLKKTQSHGTKITTREQSST